jgi:hypothetical protein
MTQTLFNIAYDLASALGIIGEGTATGGSATTVVDSINLTQTDDYWNGGTMFVLYDAGGAHASPEGKYSPVSDFVSSTYTATFTSVTDAVAVGDRYAIAKRRYPIGKIVEKINEALRALSTIEMTDTTTLDTLSDTVEYTLPVGANYDLRQVWTKGTSGDSDIMVEGWFTEKSATGSGNKLILPFSIAAGSDIKLVYTSQHATVNVATDKIDDSINPHLLVCKAAVGCLMWRTQKSGDYTGQLGKQLNYFENELLKMTSTAPVKLPTHTGKKLILSRDKRLY